jgi:hypothetical protein
MTTEEEQARQSADDDHGSRLLERLVSEVGGHARVQAAFGDPVERDRIALAATLEPSRASSLSVGCSVFKQHRIASMEGRDDRQRATRRHHRAAFTRAGD